MPWRVLLWLLLLFVGSAAHVDVSVAETGQTRAARTVAVPFVSFAEASAMEYQNKEILNPSFAASVAMILKYGGQDLSLLTKFDKALPKRRGWAIVQEKLGGDLATLKGFIDRDVPVMVSLTTTPFAHPANPILGLIAMSKNVEVPKPVPTSGALPLMWSLPQYRSLKQALGKQFYWESMLIHARVVVGYDDARQVMIVHDPMIGPGVEIPYPEFEQMWTPVDHWYSAVEPRVRRNPPADSSSPRARTQNEIAVEKFIRGYSLEAIGRFFDGAEVFRSVLKMDSLPAELRYMVLNELAYVTAYQGKYDEALKLADQASAIRPESPSPWRLRMEMFRDAPGVQAGNQRAEAQSVLMKLCADSTRVIALRESLRRYVPVGYLGC